MTIKCQYFGCFSDVFLPNQISGDFFKAQLSQLDTFPTTKCTLFRVTTKT